MLKTKQDFKQLETTLVVKEVDNETAATIQGGWDLAAYRDINFGTRIVSANSSLPTLPTEADNQISSIIINRGKWRFYDWSHYRKYPNGGGYRDLGPGKYPWLPTYGVPNDWISSFSRFKGT
ncbi:MAG: hypothetical protein HWQ35_02765 [Nostoc sp. NMS1]|uniref:beta/gamma crystallin-related protein n=1 Tax=unclassified Nostoc TaxID=2593658 RepID=UPI002600B1B9|nr:MULTISPECIES: beta/gamma crystallin-related protein [unclassified Nostoc]MBN3905528.1 hypothetical protein [Nostoc sp. NMS1]MBN3994071.1 hypothetical protein [Nostoc sp. NMS2]